MSSSRWDVLRRRHRPVLRDMNHIRLVHSQLSLGSTVVVVPSLGILIVLASQLCSQTDEGWYNVRARSTQCGASDQSGFRSKGYSELT